ncbi:MDR family MFS transporter [Embleya hyalina]|uniref:MFS transporter n=1 Tax=Embleya hyalina TaxID=516124 RepID=A0A401YSF7_9ACTN|nr:MDR family MFS transporter [Embleya hyalina]GCD97495.1 MFS transporter [Embleya hyalina]
MPPISASRLSQKVVVGAVFVSAMFVNILDVTIINVALPAIGKDLGASQAALATVAVGYLVSLAVFIPASGWLGDRFGTKRIFLIALALFTGASALCGLAQSIDQLVLFRILQGAGGGMLTPVGMAMMFRVFPPEERVRASRILMVPTALAPALGPVLGGLLVDKVSWHWVFYINLPVGVAAFVFGLMFLEEYRNPKAGRFDLPGFVLSGAGFALLMYALSEGATKGWGSPIILSTGIAGLILCVAMVFVELRVEEPMLHLRLLRDRLFVSTNVVSMVNSAAFLGVLYVFPLMQQQAFGKSALETGLLTFPEAFGVVIATQWVSRLYPVIGPRRLMAGGLLGIGACAALLALVDGDTAAVLIVVLMFCTGASMAHVMIPMQAAAFARTALADNGRASTIFNVQRQLGSALGVALLASVLAGIGTMTTGGGGAPSPNLHAYHVAFLVAAALAVLGAVAALTIRDGDAASTLRKKTEVTPTPTNPSTEPAKV